MNNAYMVVDGQWGSTGKGLIAGYLAIQRKPDAVVCNFGPNAGHTVVLNNGRVVMTQQLPSAIICDQTRDIFLGPGSVIDPDILRMEIHKYRDLLSNKTIYVHPSACIVGLEHKRGECDSLNRISSTCKGTGAAQVDKVMRIPEVIARDNPKMKGIERVVVVKNPLDYTKLLFRSELIQIESAQGLELGINSGGFYPYCTSRDISYHQIMADCGMPHHIDPEVIVSMRTYPIRVGNAIGPIGELLGTSGPVYPDQVELSWEELGVAEERTTVTNKVRRVFTWSWINFDKVMTMLNPDHIFLNFVNYLDPEPSFDSPSTKFLIREMESRFASVKWIGTGPKLSDVKEKC